MCIRDRLCAAERRTFCYVYYDLCFSICTLKAMILLPYLLVKICLLYTSMNLVYRGMPITGSWGGDCMQLARCV